LASTVSVIFGILVTTGSVTGSIVSTFFFTSTAFCITSGVASSFFFGLFLGRVEESIASKSILASTFGPSNSGASILVSEGFSATIGSGATILGSGIISTGG